MTTPGIPNLDPDDFNPSDIMQEVMTGFSEERDKIKIAVALAEDEDADEE